MTDRRLLAAAMGFAFVAAWISFNFGYALLCLLGAAVFWAAAGVLDGTVDLAEWQSRLAGRDQSPAAPPSASPRPRPRRRVR